jgi:hypothetical protein
MAARFKPLISELVDCFIAVLPLMVIIMDLIVTLGITTISIMTVSIMTISIMMFWHNVWYRPFSSFY